MAVLEIEPDTSDPKASQPLNTSLPPMRNLQQALEPYCIAAQRTSTTVY